jgi:hypothetical protein
LAAAALVSAALWLLHPGFGAACRTNTPGICLQGLWSLAQAKPPQPTATPKPPDWDNVLQRFEAAQKAADFEAALTWLDALGQIALRQYEAEEGKGATRRLRYKFVDLDLLARRLAAAGDAAAPKVALAARAYAETFAGLSSVESIDLVLRRAELRAPKTLKGAFQSPALKAAITEFWQDLAPTRVFFATDRARTDEELGIFGPALSDANQVQLGAATAAVPVYANEVAGADQKREVEDAPEQGTRQTAGVRTVKYLDTGQFSAMVGERASAGRRKDALIYIPSSKTSFENALLRAAEWKRALRIDGPALLISWAAEAAGGQVDCKGAETAKLVLLAWRRVSQSAQGAKIHLIAQQDGACAAYSPFVVAGAAAKSEVRAETMVLLEPQYWDAIHGPVLAHPEEPEARKLVYDTQSWANPRVELVQACPWDQGARERTLWSRRENDAGDALVYVPPNPALTHWPLRGPDYYVPEILNDLRAAIWLSAAPPQRCGLCKALLKPDLDLREYGPEWTLYGNRCGEAYELALDLRREHGPDALARLDRVLAGLSAADRDRVRARLQELPQAP